MKKLCKKSALHKKISAIQKIKNRYKICEENNFSFWQKAMKNGFNSINKYNYYTFYSFSSFISREQNL